MAQEKLIKSCFPILVVMAIIFAGFEMAAATTTIKVALITPEGSPWTKTLRKMTREVNEKTNGEIDFKIYAGGISGDEADVRIHFNTEADLTDQLAGLCFDEIITSPLWRV